MKKFIGLVVGILVLTVNVCGLNTKKLVAFGDSLSCNGNACIHAAQPSEMCVMYPSGRFTEGDIWLEILADKLGLKRPIPSLAGGDNFAYGGATTGWKYSKNRLNVGSQIDAYIKRSEGRIDEKNLYIIWAGGNDLKNDILPEDLISNMKAHIETLINAGGKQFLVPNFPPIGSTPTANLLIDKLGDGLGWVGKKLKLVPNARIIKKGVKALLGGFAQETVLSYNRELENVLKKLEKQNAEIKIYRFDAYEYFSHIKEHLNEYGMKHEKELFFKDGFHPSSKGHYLIANAVYRKLMEEQE